jgi:hypothetical protein
MRAPPGPATGLCAGRYILERVIGEGATATVHLARDTARGVSVAIKILRPELAESEANARFLKEIRRTSGLEHPHILPVLNSGEHEGRPLLRAALYGAGHVAAEAGAPDGAERRDRDRSDRR